MFLICVEEVSEPFLPLAYHVLEFAMDRVCLLLVLSVSHLESARGMAYATSWLQHRKGQVSQMSLCQSLPGGGEEGYSNHYDQVNLDKHQVCISVKTPSDINSAGYILYSKSSRAKHIIKALPLLMVNIP